MTKQWLLFLLLLHIRVFLENLPWISSSSSNASAKSWEKLLPKKVEKTHRFLCFNF
ncbi:hypothetical protein GLYMA_20G083051v4 [Glycine max]|nr:hypothetical protein GLYMA_20G083051v4 [Glycine max]KAH1035142.1 hypothetical protein GYH30_055219 [Glycine max]